MSKKSPLEKFVDELITTVERAESRDARAHARAGLAYLSRSGGPEPEALSQLALQAHSFVLSLVVHNCCSLIIAERIIHSIITTSSIAIFSIIATFPITTFTCMMISAISIITNFTVTICNMQCC